ncbi:MAG: hypothetical protein ACRDQV_08300 [Pseudonocardiaceae bacterium]
MTSTRPQDSPHGRAADTLAALPDRQPINDLHAVLAARAPVGRSLLGDAGSQSRTLGLSFARVATAVPVVGGPCLVTAAAVFAMWRGLCGAFSPSAALQIAMVDVNPHSSRRGRFPLAELVTHLRVAAGVGRR